jgi:hypothetical protein
VAIFLHGITWLVFIDEAGRVYCAVRTDYISGLCQSLKVQTEMNLTV